MPTPNYRTHIIKHIEENPQLQIISVINVTIWGKRGGVRRSRRGAMSPTVGNYALVFDEYKDVRDLRAVYRNWKSWVASEMPEPTHIFDVAFVECQELNPISATVL